MLIDIIQTEPAYCWHAEQKIVLNETGRLRLIQALQSKETDIEVFCHDGEGYTLELLYGEEYIKPYYRTLEEVKR